MAETIRDAKHRVHGMSRRDDWETPPELFARLDREFRFTLDAAANDTNAKCARYFTERENGLAQDWGTNRVWLNPPYGRLISLWMEKALRANRCGTTVICLVPARTDTAWWHDYAEKAAERRFLRGRVRFLLDGRPMGDRSKGGATSPFPSAIVIFR